MPSIVQKNNLEKKLSSNYIIKYEGVEESLLVRAHSSASMIRRLRYNVVGSEIHEKKRRMGFASAQTGWCSS